jgi:hypothetical protein
LAHYQARILETKGGIGDETFRAVEDVMVAVAYGRRLQRRGVGAGFGLGLRQYGVSLS